MYSFFEFEIMKGSVISLKFQLKSNGFEFNQLQYIAQRIVNHTMVTFSSFLLPKKGVLHYFKLF